MSLLTRTPAWTNYRGVLHLPVRSLYITSKRSAISLQSKVYKTYTDHNFKLLARSTQTMASAAVSEVLPPPLDATSEPPTLFDGTTRLYVNYGCPFAQRAWITRNAKGAQDKIKLVPIDFASRPAWYKEKVYPEGKVPALEHNGKIIGESLDLIRYIDANFEGPSLLPEDPAKLKFADEAITKFDTFYKNVFGSFKAEDPVKVAAPEFDFLEEALNKFNDGPYFLGQFSQVDIAFIPLIERFQIFFKAQWNYDITAGRPKLAAFIEAIDEHEAYKQTKCNPEELVEAFRARFL